MQQLERQRELENVVKAWSQMCEDERQNFWRTVIQMAYFNAPERVVQSALPITPKFFDHN